MIHEKVCCSTDNQPSRNWSRIHCRNEAYSVLSFGRAGPLQSHPPHQRSQRHRGHEGQTNTERAPTVRRCSSGSWGDGNSRTAKWREKERRRRDEERSIEWRRRRRGRRRGRGGAGLGWLGVEAARVCTSRYCPASSRVRRRRVASQRQFKSGVALICRKPDLKLIVVIAECMQTHSPKENAKAQRSRGK